MRNELISVAQKAAASVPPAYLLGWVAGVRWDMVAAILTCVWTLGLIWQSWLWRPLVKPWWERRRGREG